MFTSIQHNFRGFSYNRDYENKDLFKEEIEAELEATSEISWAHLFSEDGKMVASYRRGLGFADFQKGEIRDEKRT